MGVEHGIVCIGFFCVLICFMEDVLWLCEYMHDRMCIEIERTLGSANVTLGFRKKHDCIGMVIYYCLALCTTNVINEKRWQVEGTDVEVGHGAVATHRLALINKHLWRRWALHLPPLHRLVQWTVKEGRVTSKGLDRLLLLRLEGEGTRWWLM